MNLNELMAQQQQMLNQAMQNAQHMQMAYAAIVLGLLLVHCLVVYAFYARLRGIENEIMKFRIAYQFAHDRESSAVPHR